MKIKCSCCSTIIEGEFQPILEVRSIEDGKARGESLTVQNAIECSCNYIIFKNRPDLWKINNSTKRNLNKKSN